MWSNNNYYYYNYYCWINLSKEKEGGREYSQSDLDNYEFKISGMDEELIKKIPNYDDFTLRLKEYTYKKGIIQGNNAQFVEYDENKMTNILSIVFNLNDKNKTKIVALIDLKTNTYNFRSDKN